MNKWKQFAEILELDLEQEFLLTDVDGNTKVVNNSFASLLLPTLPVNNENSNMQIVNSPILNKNAPHNPPIRLLISAHNPINKPLIIALIINSLFFIFFALFILSCAITISIS